VPHPSGLVGRIAFWAIFLSAFSLAASVLGVAALTGFIGAVWAYLPNVIAAVLIFLVASAVAAGVVALVHRTMGDTPLGKVVQTAVPVLVLTIATFMILEQLKIAHDIVVTTYTLVLGAIALGAALAFGSAAATSRDRCSRARTRRARRTRSSSAGISTRACHAPRTRRSASGTSSTGGP
jgi:hypothetical protein